MRDTLTCVKCSSQRVLEMKGSSMTHGNIAYGSMKMSYAIKDYFVCVDCGYLETYIRQTPKFKRWAEKEWRKTGRRFDDYV